MVQFGHLQTIHDDLAAESLPLEIHVLGVNGAGYEGGNAQMTSGRTLPWCQDVPEVNAWGLWQAGYRDVVVLDAENRVVDVYNLTEHDLSDPANRDALKTILRGVATP